MADPPHEGTGASLPGEIRDLVVALLVLVVLLPCRSPWPTFFPSEGAER